VARLGAWLVLALLAAYLMFVGGGWLGIYQSELRALTVILTGVVLAGWSLLAIQQPSWRPGSRLAIPLLICLGSLGVSTVFSRSPRVSAEYLGYAILLIALYLLLVRLMANPFFARRLLALGAVLFLVIAVEFVGGIGLLWGRWWAISGQITLPPLRPYFIGLSYGNPSAVLTIIALLGVPAAATLPASRRAAGAAGISLVVAVVAILSGSRGGWLALAIAAFVGVVIALLSPSGRTVAARLRPQLASAGSVRARQVVVLAGGAVLIAIFAVILPAVLRRADAGGEDLRTQFLVVALRLFAQAPAVGTGPGTWVIERIAATQAGEIDYYIPHAHNVPLQTLAELGILGAVAGAVLIAAVAALLVRALRSRDGSRRWIGWCTVVALVYLAVHNLIDFYPNMPAALFAMALPLAYLDATEVHSKAADAGTTAAVGHPRPPMVAMVLGLLACGVAVVALVLQEFPAGLNQGAVAAANANRWSDALALANDAVRRDADMHSFEMTAGLAAAHVGDLPEAAAAFRVVAERDDLPEAWLDLAAIEARLGKTGDASNSLARAMRLGQQRVAVAMAAGDLYMQLGQRDRAVTTFRGALELRPSLGGDPWWNESVERSGVFRDALRMASSALGPDGRWELALETRDSAATLAAASSASNPQLSRDVTLAWGGDHMVADRLFRSCRNRPADLGPLLWCRRVALRLADNAEAAVFGGLAEGVSPGSTENGAELRVRGGTGSPDEGATTTTALFWGTYTYRRPAPADLLVPGLVHLVLR
jgi:O-antigen ligase